MPDRTAGLSEALKRAEKTVAFEQATECSGTTGFFIGFDLGYLAAVSPVSVEGEDERVQRIRADQITEGDRLWIEDEAEWYAASRVVVRADDVLLWLEGEDDDEPWDALRLDQTMWRLAACPSPPTGLSEDGIERGAMHLAAADGDVWERLPEDTKEAYRSMFRKALTAAYGSDSDDE